MIWMLFSKPFSFCTMVGWAVVMDRLLAVPPPTLVTSMPRTAGSLGMSSCGVKGSSPNHRLLQEIVDLQLGLRIDGNGGWEDRNRTRPRRTGR